jgi:hypothetical protein
VHECSHGASGAALFTGLGSAMNCISGAEQLMSRVADYHEAVRP